ncbi:Peroxiredoxin DOT5 [Gracilariopsis chorda]|uniref:Peroxiredoxin DOT5 n=1 Tax=Gracilariopsis chorda TaxID=448386 RepID=A0A2V3ILH9_9FLOR|nr:Peroxiredoxin DOT5 [Gracilariopsis chorda]|eukprot:PXF42908.1 Peroxiredoxin DOT5 [Gracilariopsis chorda]
MVSTRSKTGAAPPHSPVKTITKRRHDKPSPLASTKSPKRSATTPPAFPDLSLHNDTGALISTHSLLSEHTPGLILFTYPRANTGGCTTQAKGLSNLQDAARKAGYNIVGCSYDSVKSQAAWKVKSSISVPLLCDTPTIGLLRKLSVHKAPRSAKRSVFVVARQHDKVAIVLAKRAVSPKDSIALVEQYIRDHPLSAAAANDHPVADDKSKTAASETAPPKEPASDENMTDVPAKPAQEQPPEPAEDAPKPQPEKEQSSDKPEPTSAAKQPQPPPPVADKPAADKASDENASDEKPSDHETSEDEPHSTSEPTATEPTTDPKPQEQSDNNTPTDKPQSHPQPPAQSAADKPVTMDVEKPQQDEQS